MSCPHSTKPGAGACADAHVQRVTLADGCVLVDGLVVAPRARAADADARARTERKEAMIDTTGIDDPTRTVLVPPRPAKSWRVRLVPSFRGLHYIRGTVRA